MIAYIQRVLQLGLAFAKVGIGAFGGGLSSLPLIEHELVTETHWLTLKDFNQVVGLSQVTPGPIAINAATFVGYQQAGVIGSIVATFSLVGAPLLILAAAMVLLKRCSAEQSGAFRRAMAPLVSALLTLALISPLKSTYHGGLGAVALFIIGVPVISKVKFFKSYPFVLFMLFGAIALVLPL